MDDYEDDEGAVDYGNLEHSLTIDETVLDEEWIEQPKLYFHWARKLADARRSLDESKSNLDVVKAELDRAIRSDPERFGLPKVTEAVVTTAIPNQPKYQSALEVLRNDKHTVDILSAAVTALDHRKAALGKLVDLHGQNYFSSPRASTPEAEESMREVVKKKVRKKSQRNRS